MGALRRNMDRARGPGEEVSRIGAGRAAELLAGACLMFLTGSSALADDPELDPDRIEFVIGNATFVALHEFAHALIEDFDVPVLGNGEDAADTLAAVSLIRRDRADPAADFRYIRMLLMAADANQILWKRGLEQDNPVVYLARHPLSVQRAARIACLVYGSDPELLEPLPDIVGLPEFRADWCEEEYAAAERAYLWVSYSYVGRISGKVSEHDFYYGPARDEETEPVRAWLVENQALERLLAVVGQSILLEDAVTLTTRSCGSPDAYWDGNTRELVVCYELIAAFYRLSEEQGIKDLEEKIRTFHREDSANTE